MLAFWGEGLSRLQERPPDVSNEELASMGSASQYSDPDNKCLHFRYPNPKSLHPDALYCRGHRPGEG